MTTLSEVLEEEKHAEEINHRWVINLVDELARMIRIALEHPPPDPPELIGAQFSFRKPTVEIRIRFTRRSD